MKNVKEPLTEVERRARKAERMRARNQQRRGSHHDPLTPGSHRSLVRGSFQLQGERTPPSLLPLRAQKLPGQRTEIDSSQNSSPELPGAVSIKQPPAAATRDSRSSPQAPSQRPPQGLQMSLSQLRRDADSTRSLKDRATRARTPLRPLRHVPSCTVSDISPLSAASVTLTSTEVTLKARVAFTTDVFGACMGPVSPVVEAG